MEAFAARLAALPSACEVDQIAIESAERNAYMLRAEEQGGRRPAGRPLSAKSLVETGISGLLLAGDPIDEPAVAAELAAYLAGPPAPMWSYAITDGNIALTTPVAVPGGWQLVTPSQEELASLAGIPSAAAHVPRRSLHHDLYGGLAMLRRIEPLAKARSGTVIYWTHPSWDLWQPLLALSLYQNPVLHLWAQYEVEPGRRIDEVFDHVYTEPWTPDGVTEVEIVRPGAYEISADGEQRFRRYLELLAPLLDTALRQPAKPTKASKEREARLRRIAEHFLAAGKDAHGEGDVLSELNAEAVLHYVIALEAVLTGGDDEKTELTRKVVQRAAILAGHDDQDRNGVAATIQAAYNARSRYAHGAESENIDLPALRQVVRDCILARLILGDPAADGLTLSQLADRALLDHSLLAYQVHEPITRLWAMIDGHGERGRTSSP